MSDPDSSTDIPGAIDLVDFYPISGVYFLWIGADVVYVGQSSNLRVRVFTHMRRWKNLAFTKICYIPVHPRNLLRVESYWISKLNPPLNGGSMVQFFRDSSDRLSIRTHTPPKPTPQKGERSYGRACRELRAERRKTGLTKSEAAKRLGLNPSVYSSYESGARYAPPSLIAEVKSLNFPQDQQSQ